MQSTYRYRPTPGILAHFQLMNNQVPSKCQQDPQEYNIVNLSLSSL